MTGRASIRTLGPVDRSVRSHPAPRLRPPPSVSVVIPTYRRPAMLGRCLAALLLQTLAPPEFEILVCDDACDPAAHDLVAWIGERSHPAGFRVIYLPVTGSRGPAGARNRGWQLARACVVAFTDDDAIPDRHWLERGLAAMRGGASAVTGRIVVPLPPRPTDYERDCSGLSRAAFATANCFVYKPMLERVGGFDPRYTVAGREDADLQFAILGAGGTIARADDAVVVHPVHPAQWGVSVLQQRKAQFDALLYKKHPKLYRSHVAASPPWRHYAIVALALVAAAAWLAGSPSIAAGAAAGWLALTLAFVLERLRTTTRRLAHVAEMALTSAVIPPLSVFWRLYGAAKFRTAFF
jgi:cellulose synthase/poly-beta-1,6-N-acetylglucosamine synthase-like glycosyltransferase